MTDHPTYLAKLVHRLASDLGYTNASGLSAVGVWIDANEDGKNYTWRVKWPADIIQELVSFTNPKGNTTNSDLKLAALVL